MKSDTDLETRIAREYELVRPSPELRDELLGNLPVRRAPERRVAWARPALAAAAAIVAVAVLFWPRPQDDAPALDGAEGEFALPVVGRPGKGATTVEELDAPRQIVQLTRDGTVQVPEWEPFRGGLRAVTLAGLAGRLAEIARLFHEEQQANGASGYEGRASRLNVAFRVDGDAPWQHVQWLLIVCAEQRFARTWFAALDRAGGDEYLLDARLPVDVGVVPEDGPEVVKVQVAIVPRKYVAAPRGDVVTQVVYRFGAHETDDLSLVGRWADDALRAVNGKDLRVVGEIKAEARVPHRYVASVLAVLRERGIDRVDFYGTATPTDEERRAATLPYPTGGWPGGEEEDAGEEEPGGH